MNILNFSQRFPDELSCREHFRDVRIKNGVKCKKCGCKKHYWLQKRGQFKCKKCDFRTTLRSGTVMEHSNLSFRTWYIAMCFMTSTKKGISACEMQRQLGISQYITVWRLMHKIRKMMGKRDDRYTLKDMIEFDEGFFETEVSAKVRQNLSRGKGSERQVNVAVLAESLKLEDLKDGAQSSFCGHFKLKVLSSQKSYSVDEMLKKCIDKDCIVFSDMASTYNGIENYVDEHVMEKSSAKTTATTLKWVHIAISNAKRNFLGIYHKIKGMYLQNYLDEFAYRLNRRHRRDIFDRLIVASILF